MATHEQQRLPSSVKDRVALLALRRAIFHFVPVPKRGVEGVAPALMDEETPLDSENTHLIQDRVRRALSSPHAFEVEFDPAKATPVRGLVEQYFSDSGVATFVSVSQELAKALFTVQKGYNSPGLLALLDCSLGPAAAIVLVKLESETGSRLFTEEAAGHRRYQMKVLRDLFLTEGTRVFKSALFTSPVEDMQVLACDDQRSSVRQYEVARFFLEQFLGCKRIEVGYVVTKRFYGAAVDFLNSRVSGERQRSDLYDDLVSQLRRNIRRLDLRDFAREFVPSPLRDEFLKFMKEKGVPLSFQKDTSEINSYLRKKVIRTAHGIVLRVPEEVTGLVQVEAGRVVVNDSPEVIRGST
jgi:hypothetical protein